MSKPLKIAVYSGVIPSTTFIERLIRGLGKRNHQILLFGVLKKKQNYSKNITVIDYGNSKLDKVLHYLKYLILLSLFKSREKAQLDKWLKHSQKDLWTFKLKFYPVLYQQPEIFHIQWAKSLDDWMWLKDFGIKVVLSLRGAHINYSPIADQNLAHSYRENFPNVNVFHAVSRSIKNEAMLYGASSHKIKVVYSGLPDTLINEGYRLKNNKKFQILSVGRDHWKKGYSYSLDAMGLLKETFQDFHYTLIGTDQNIEMLYQISDLKLGSFVDLQSSKPFDETIDFIKNADILLLPSVEEGIANVVLEAMAVGTMVLSTDCGGMTELIKDGINGFIVPIRNPEAIANKLKLIYSLTDDQRQQIIENAQQTVKHQHSEEQMISGMEDLYKTLYSEN